MRNIVFLISCILTQVQSQIDTIVLLPNTPQIVSLDPFEVYEVLIPVDSIEADTTYAIKKSFIAASATDTIIKRKKLEVDIDAQFEDSDFNKRYSKAFSMGLAHHRWSSEFTLSTNGQYKDDPEGRLYEIIGSKHDSKKYLVFNLTSMKAVMAFDEETLYSETEVGLELIQES